MSIHNEMDHGKEGEYWIAVDLDGTLAEYDTFKGPEHIGKPIPGMLDKIHTAMDEGKKVAIYSARVGDQMALHHLMGYLIKLGLGHLEITNIKKPKFKEFWDDRAFRVEKNTGEFVKYQQENSKPSVTDLVPFEDTGSHYRYSYKGVNLDPARICNVYGITNLVQGGLIKKALRAGTGGHKDIIQDIDDIICAANRWKQMIMEDEE